MHITEILFWILTALALFSALMVVSSDNPVHSVLWLILVFISITGHYILMNAQFLAIVNMIVYAGAIMVLFLFVIMFMNLNKESEPQKSSLLRLAAVISGGSLLLIMIAALKDNAGYINSMKGEGSIGLIKNLVKTLFTEYVVSFEISSILFLSAMVGAVVLGKKDSSIPAA